MTYSYANRYLLSNRRAATTLLWLTLLLLSAALPAQANTLTAIDTQSAGAGQLTIRLTLAQNAPIPSVFTINDPARLSIDLPDTSLAVSDRYQTIDRGAVQAVSAASAGGTTRVVIKLSQMVTYNLHRQGRQLLITLGNQNSRAAADAAPPPVAPARPRASNPSTTASSAARDNAYKPRQTPVQESASGTATAVRHIDFRRTAKGAGQIKITLNASNAPADVSEINGKVVARLPGVRLPDSLRKRLDVTDFATPVQTIDALGNGNNTRLVITPAAGANYEQLAYQTGHDFFIELQPLSQAEQTKRQQNNPKYTGKKISLSFQNVDVRQVLQIIADVADVNMVISDSVSGTMALRLEDVPWDQALDIILNAKGLGMQRQNNVITVAPLPEIAAREKAELVARKASSDLAPLHSEIIQINYAQAAGMAALLKSDSPTSVRSGRATLAGGTSPGNTSGGDNGTSLLSNRGHVTVDDRTNSLLITDTRGNLDRIRRLIHRLDIPVRQVLIQSRIVIANRDFTRNLGVSQTGTDSSHLNNAINNGFDANNHGYSVSLPATGATSLLSGSIITDTFSLNLELSAMETENRGEIISSPRVITADGQEANIEQGREIPYQQGSQGSNAGTSVSFKKAVLSLNATPKITPDNKVQMSLKVTQDSVGAFVPTSNGGSVPSIDTRSLTTNVLVNDGDTVVLGGVFEQTNNDQSSGVPFIKDIPLLGRLFSGTQRQRNKRELLIFVTPRILRDTLRANR